MNFLKHSGLAACALAMNIPASAQAQPRAPLQATVDAAATETLARFKERGLKEEQLAISLIDLSAAGDGADLPVASFRGDAPIYPASVVKLFYQAAVERWAEDGKLADTPELRRAVRDMIVDSSNDATALAVDALTETTGGPELAGAEWDAWKEKRNVVSRFFAALGYNGCNIVQKTWNEGPYGRERQFVGANYDNRNALTTAATARLLSDVARERWVSPERSRAMLALLSRDPRRKAGAEPRGRVSEALAEADAAVAREWSKGGWTSQVRHDAACIELPATAQRPRALKFVLVVFTAGHATDGDIVPALAREVIARLAGN